MFKRRKSSKNSNNSNKPPYDVVLKIEKRSFYAHRVVLLDKWRYFSNHIFNNQIQMPKEIVVSLDPAIVSPDVLDDILQHVYKNDIKFNDQNAIKICVAVNFFGYEDLLTEAENYLKSNMKAKIVFECLEMSRRIELNSLEKECNKFILKNSLAENAKRDQIPWLSFENLNIILKKLQKNGDLEEMFYLVVDWVKFDAEKRKAILPGLLGSIPLRNLSLKFLYEVVGKERIVLENTDFGKFVLELLSEFTSNDSIIVFGGKTKNRWSSNGQEVSSISRFESSKGAWAECASMKRVRAGFGCAVIGDKIYLSGGYNRSKRFNRLEVYDTQTQTFQKLKRMRRARKECTLVELNGFLYAAGGDRKSTCLNKVERYSLATGKWEKIPPMQTFRYGSEMVQVNGKLYNLGGYDQERNISNVVECYDPISKIWEFKKSMISGDAYFGAVSFRNKIYVVGKTESAVYYPKEDYWDEMPAPDRCDGGRSLVVFKDQLVVIGGENQENENFQGTRKVQYFDFEDNVWFTGNPMNIPRCYHRAAVVTSQCFTSHNFHL